MWSEEFGAGLHVPEALQLDAGSVLHTVANISVGDDGNLTVLPPAGAAKGYQVRQAISIPALAYCRFMIGNRPAALINSNNILIS